MLHCARTTGARQTGKVSRTSWGVRGMLWPYYCIDVSSNATSHSLSVFGHFNA